MGFLFSHRLSFQIDSVSIVNQPTQDGIGQGGIGDDFMPVIDGQLAGEQGASLGRALIY